MEQQLTLTFILPARHCFFLQQILYFFVVVFCYFSANPRCPRTISSSFSSDSLLHHGWSCLSLISNTSSIGRSVVPRSSFPVLRPSCHRHCFLAIATCSFLKVPRHSRTNLTFPHDLKASWGSNGRDCHPFAKRSGDSIRPGSGCDVGNRTHTGIILGTTYPFLYIELTGHLCEVRNARASAVCRRSHPADIGNRPTPALVPKTASFVSAQHEWPWHTRPLG